MYRMLMTGCAVQMEIRHPKYATKVFPPTDQVVRPVRREVTPVRILVMDKMTQTEVDVDVPS